jgi:hydroxymethylpyrimidine pyrophosphatase-like HAD family hydrolase
VIRLVATDLDGTLLHSDGSVTERTRRALTAVEKLGVTVVFVTGRPIRWMDDLWQHVGGHGLAVCSNGGIVYDVHEHEVRRARTIPVGIGLEVADILRTRIPGTTFAIERTDGFAKEPGFMPRLPPPPDLAQGPLDRILDDRAVKLLARHEELGPERFWEQVESEVGHLVTTTWSSVGALVEMSAAGVTKASTLQMVCEERGIASHEVVAFGDMPNDLPMLEWAGTSYAMVNAHDSVRALAAHVAPANDEDGVAQVLEQLFDVGT